MSAHKVPFENENAQWVLPDPAVGNTTASSGILPSSKDVIVSLVATNAVTQEERYLPDPPKAGLELTLILYRTAGASLRVIAQTAIVTAGSVNTLFSAANQFIHLKSIPYYNGTVNSYRWQKISHDGPTIS